MGFSGRPAEHLLLFQVPGTAPNRTVTPMQIAGKKVVGHSHSMSLHLRYLLLDNGQEWKESKNNEVRNLKSTLREQCLGNWDRCWC